MQSQTLFNNYKLGPLTLKNRFVMAAMTRCRADPKIGAPTDLHVEYYTQRASAGLILTECSPVSEVGKSYIGTPGLFTEEQTQGWKKVVDAVHAKGGLIVNQIWHAGRTNIPALTGSQHIAPSAISVTGSHGGHAFTTPKEMTKEDIKEAVEQFRVSAKNAKKAGFDGLELHGANGYLVHQFLSTGTNKRTDNYGGSVENRARFGLEVIDVLIEVFGADRVGIKLSPVTRHNDMYDENPLETYTYFIKELDKRGIAFIELVEAEAFAGSEAFNATGTYKKPSEQIPDVSKTFRPLFKGTIIINNGLNAETATKAIDEGTADLASFGRPWLANPDYIERVRNNWPLNPVDWSTLFTGETKGYTDYPLYSKAQ